MANEPCGFCGHYLEPLYLWKDFYRHTDGGVICEANLVCGSCAEGARKLDERLAKRGLLTWADR